MAGWKPTQTYIKNLNCGTVKNVTCPNCKKQTQFIKGKNVTIRKLLFIPVIDAVNSTCVLCSECNTVYELDLDSFRKIRDSHDILLAIEEQTSLHKEIAALRRERKRARILGSILCLPSSLLPALITLDRFPFIAAVIISLSSLTGFLLIVGSFSDPKYKVLKRAKKTSHSGHDHCSP